MEKEYSQWRDPLMYAMLALALSVLLLAIARFASSRAKIDVSGLKPVPTLALSQDKIESMEKILLQIQVEIVNVKNLAKDKNQSNAVLSEIESVEKMLYQIQIKILIVG